MAENGFGLILDCDGVLADTERDGHLPAFNTTFADYRLPVRWSEIEYADKLRIGGGRERLASLFDDPVFMHEADVPDGEDERRELLASWHRTKTDWFTTLVEGGKLPPRPGIVRLVGEALDDGWTVAVASTSAEEPVRAVLEHAVGPDLAERVPVFAGDVVPAEKPDPGVYRLAVEQLGLDPRRTRVIEDSRNGLLAATGAGLRCVVTISSFTREEDFEGAELVVSDLGEPGGAPIDVLASAGHAHPGDYVTLDDLRACLEAGESAGARD